ncbi:TIGR01459 family HAD-type hydrolase [Aestuariibius sp. HNIBRBA575]|uniref:TIGR01459 family HAD-type hydrolase n=1 Tax=Aestuariibius sp. HNIBRBA575 TaxID=3233343 RepID=UPI0034A5322C
MTRIISSLAEVTDQYDAAYVDLWGCVHNGIIAHQDAVEALRAFRAAGKVVVLVTNSPRPRANVEPQLREFQVPEDCWDTIATSGDSARSAMFQGAVGQKVWFVGQPHEAAFFEPLNLLDQPLNVQTVPLEEAEGIVCCGPENPEADPAEYRAQFLYAKQKGLKLLCANPDIVVDRGETREWCAGALAALYTEMGGESLYFGKPHPPIYDLAARRLMATGLAPANPRILAIGDGIRTDILGALGDDIDSLFITGGLAAKETKTTHQPDENALNAFIENEKITPTYAIGQLR